MCTETPRRVSSNRLVDTCVIDMVTLRHNKSNAQRQG